MIISTYRKLWDPSPTEFPKFSGTRIMMMPVIIGYLQGVPNQYINIVSKMYNRTEKRYIGSVGYLTIDEKIVKKGETLRRSGLHVDGYYHGRCGAWGGGGGWGSVGNGMLTISSTAHCRAYLGMFEGTPGPEGECGHIELDKSKGETFDAGYIYWVDGACIHESLPVEEDTERQFVRLSMPSNGPWFENYTPNPCGIKPSGEVLPNRDFMKEGLS